MNDEYTNPNQVPVAQAQPVDPEIPIAPHPGAQPIQTTVAAPQGIVAPPAQPQPIQPAATVPGAIPTNIANPGKKRKLKIILIASLAIVLLAGSYLGFSFWTLQQNKKAANEKLDDVYSIVRDPNFRSSQDLKDLIFKEMGYNEFETDNGKINEILLVAATLGFINAAKDVSQTDNFLGRDTAGKLQGSRKYNIKISDKQSSPIKLTLRVVKEGKNWELDAADLDPTIESLMRAAGQQLPIKSGSGFQFNQ